MKNFRSGMSVVELTLAVSLSAVVGLMLASGLSSATKIRKQLTSKVDADLELARALGDILKVGRIAQACSCAPETFPVPLPVTYPCWWLECRVDRNLPPTTNPADDVEYRFGRVGGQFHWLQKQVVAGVNAWVPFVSYDSISEFAVCDDNLMGKPNPSVIPGAVPGIDYCSIPQTEIAKRHLNNVNAATFPTPPNRYFSFRLTALVPATGASKSIQSAFFVRHPTLSGILYQWGQHWND